MTLARRIAILIDWFYRPPFNRIMPLQTFRYAVCGGTNMLFDLTLYAIVYNFVLDKEIVHLHFIAFESYIAAWLMVFPITFFTGFWLNRHIAFRYSPLRGRIQLFRYLLSVAGAFGLNYLFLKFFVEAAGIYPTPANALTKVIVVCYSYLMQKYFTFRGCEEI